MGGGPYRLDDAVSERCDGRAMTGVGHGAERQDKARRGFSMALVLLLLLVAEGAEAVVKAAAVPCIVFSR